MICSNKPLNRARVLITNDDGIDAPGLKLLERIARSIAGELWVVAPESEQSGAGHSLTLRQPLRIRKVSVRRFAVDGTPTDCVLMGINKVMRECRPDLVLSGINCGANLGEDVTYSGTVAAAMEGTLLGIPSVAFSQVTDDRRGPRWAVAEEWAATVIERLYAVDWPRNVMINVNFPDVAAKAVTGIEATCQGQRKIGDQIAEGADPRGRPYFWIGAQRSENRYKPGADLEAVSRGAISVTPLFLDLTHKPSLKILRALFQ